MPDGLGKENEQNLRDWFNNFIRKGDLKTKYPGVNWDALIDSYLSGEGEEVSMRAAEGEAPKPLPKGVNEAFQELISKVEAATGVTPQMLTEAGMPEYWAGLSDEDKDYHNDFVDKLRSDAQALGEELTAEQLEDAETYFASLVQVRGDYEATTGIELSGLTLADFLNTEAGFQAVAVSRIEFPDSIAHLMDESRFTEAILERANVTPPQYGEFTKTNLRDFPPSLQRAFTENLQGIADEKAKEIAQTTGKDYKGITIEEALGALTEGDIEAAREQALLSWGNEFIPLQGGSQQLLRAAKIMGTTPAETLMSYYQDWKAGFHPEYTETRGEAQLWSDFLGSMEGVVEYIGNTLTGEKPTQKYEYSPPEERIGLKMLKGGGRVEIPPTEGGWGVATEQPEGGEITSGGAPPIDITQAEAKKGYLGELKRREYGPEDVAYLSQFFNTLLPGPYPIKVAPRGPGGWYEMLSGLDIPSPPRKEQKKTRFYGGIR